MAIDKNRKIYIAVITLFFPIFVSAQDVTSSFPYSINFSESELKLLKSLDGTTLQKLISVAKLIVTNKSAQTTIQPTQTVYSNTYSTTTPYLDPTTNKYSSKPITNQNLNNPCATGGMNTGYYSGYGNTYLNSYGTSNTPCSNPYSPYTSNSLFPNSSIPGLSPQSQNSLFATPPIQDQNASLVNRLQNIMSPNNHTQPNQNTNQNQTPVEIPSEVIDMCKSNYGMDRVFQSCSTIEGLTNKVKQDMMLACTLLKKRIKINSGHRSVACEMTLGRTDPGPHGKGIALDLNLSQFSSTEAQTFLMFMRQKDYLGVGCYGVNGHVHLDHGTKRRWGWEQGCPKELLQVYGSLFGR